MTTRRQFLTGTAAVAVTAALPAAPVNLDRVLFMDTDLVFPLPPLAIFDYPAMKIWFDGEVARVTGISAEMLYKREPESR